MGDASGKDEAARGQGQSIAAQTLSTMLRIFLFSAPDCLMTVA